MINVFVDSYDRTHRAGAVLDEFEDLVRENTFVSIAGRVVSKRVMGKAMFFNVLDGDKSIQVFVSNSVVGKDEFQRIAGETKIGNIVGVSGQVFTTKTDEKTVRCQKFQLLTPSMKSLPEKFHGLSNIETRYRQRYLDLISNQSVMTVFQLRSKLVKAIRHFLETHDFMEVETPVFQKAPCGASANPFVTHHDAKDIDLYLRISPETFLKQLIIGGMDRVYEIGKNFRNEGTDPSHLQEFTMLEFYASYWNYHDNIEFSKKLIQDILVKTVGSLQVEYQGTILDFEHWDSVTYQDLVLGNCGIDVLEYESAQDLMVEIKKRNIDVGTVSTNISIGNLIDKLYKKVSRPGLVQPTILLNHPSSLIPLARVNDNDPRIIDSFQILVNGWEVAKGYSELGDPILQRKLLEEQSSMRQGGDDEAMFLDDAFLTSLEYGMPPVSGVGIGIDRIVALVADQPNLSDVVLFPLMA